MTCQAVMVQRRTIRKIGLRCVVVQHEKENGFQNGFWFTAFSMTRDHSCRIMGTWKHGSNTILINKMYCPNSKDTSFPDK